MRPRYRPRPKTPDYHETYVEVDGEEIDCVKCYFESSEPEPDVGWAGDFQLLSVMHGEVDIMDKLEQAEIDQLEMRIIEYLNAYGEDIE